MFDDIVNFKEIRSDKIFPKVMMVVVVESINKVDDVDCGGFHHQGADGVSYGDFGEHIQLRIHKDED